VITPNSAEPAQQQPEQHANDSKRHQYSGMGKLTVVRSSQNLLHRVLFVDLPSSGLAPGIIATTTFAHQAAKRSAPLKAFSISFGGYKEN
jgi:hypothetical protein